MSNILKDVISNKKRIFAVISLVLLIAQSHGLDLTKWIGVDWQTTLSNIFMLIALIGIGDNGGATNETNQEVPQDESIPTVDNAESLTQLKLQQIQQIINS